MAPISVAAPEMLPTTMHATAWEDRPQVHMQMQARNHPHHAPRPPPHPRPALTSHRLPLTTDKQQHAYTSSTPPSP